MTLSYVILNS